MNQSIRVGVVGVGSIGKNHARICAALKEAKFAAIYDTNNDVARSIGRQYNVPVVNSLDEFVALVDAATVAAPTNTHYEIGRRLLEAGKHVLIEKPITETPKEAEELVRLARERSLILQVGHVERFNPVMSALQELLTRPVFIEVHRLSQYPFRSLEIGVVLDLMIHDLEIILHLVRSPVKSIDAVGLPALSKTEDIANARIRFQSGCVANLTASRISPEKMRKIRVFQAEPQTYLSLDYQNQAGEIHRLVNGQITREKVQIEKDEPLKRELQAFIECASRGQQPLVSGYEATAALELAIKITELVEENLKLVRAGGEGAEGAEVRSEK
ncbi:MAG TPA: Gfo/Idh/MocA family oxidoreductase [Chthoniobacterales bacterium]|nr:Gfo/Idh/MocA family oxidoreductase [Chthoniobacterales bacterium]